MGFKKFLFSHNVSWALDVTKLTYPFREEKKIDDQKLQSIETQLYSSILMPSKSGTKCQAAETESY